MVLKPPTSDVWHKKTRCFLCKPVRVLFQQVSWNEPCLIPVGRWISVRSRARRSWLMKCPVPGMKSLFLKGTKKQMFSVVSVSTRIVLWASSNPAMSMMVVSIPASCKSIKPLFFHGTKLRNCASWMSSSLMLAKISSRKRRLCWGRTEVEV